MCGNILCEKTDPAKPFFTLRGSFWTNCTTELLANTKEEDRQSRTRNRCNGEGYETVALIPLRWQGKTFGLVQFNDKRKGCLTAQQIEQLEEMAECVSITLAKLQSDEALRQSEEKFSLVSKLAPVGIYIASPQGKCSYVNDFWCEMAGLTFEEAVGKEWVQCIHPDDRPGVYDDWNKMVAAKGHWGKEYRLQHKNGKTTWVFGLAAPQKKPDGSVAGYLGINIDITDRKRADREQEKHLNELHRKNEEMDHILSIASHDLKSPLVNIEGFAGELEKSVKSLSKMLSESLLKNPTRKKLDDVLNTDIPEALHFIKMSCRMMDTLLSGLLRLSRIDMTSVSLTALDVNTLVSGILNRMQFKIQENNINITVKKGLPACRGDVTLITQVFANLIDNAIKYRQPGRPCRIRIDGYQKDGHSIYRIKDNGIGIASEQVENIFELFHQLNPDAGGEGVGLTIVRRVLERQQGNVKIDSEVGKGTVISVTLPGL
jgi:PAS domain S-box-containing protein